MTRRRTEAKTLFTHPRLALAARIIVGCLFIYAGFDKIRHPDLFAEAVYNYQLLPKTAVNIVAIWLPWLELLCGGLLLLGVWTRGSALLVIGMLIVFLGALGYNLARGLDVGCGCFSTRSVHPSTMLTLFRDLVVFVVSCYVFWVYQFGRVERKTGLGGDSGKCQQ